jgi:hypothetical protein
MKTMMACFGAFLIGLSPALSLENQNGLEVQVARKTLDRNDTHESYYQYEHIDRTMALHVIAKNASMKEMPEGLIEYSLLVKKHNYSPGYYEIYSGTEKLKALKMGETADVVIGSAQITGWTSSGETSKDKLEYQIIIKHEGKVTLKMSTTPAFEALAARAHKG